MKNRTKILLWSSAPVDTFFSRDEKVLAELYAVPGGYSRQYPIVRVFTRRAREYPDYREKERTE